MQAVACFSWNIRENIQAREIGILKYFQHVFPPSVHCIIVQEGEKWACNEKPCLICDAWTRRNETSLIISPAVDYSSRLPLYYCTIMQRTVIYCSCPAERELNSSETKHCHEISALVIWSSWYPNACNIMENITMRCIVAYCSNKDYACVANILLPLSLLSSRTEA